MPNWNQSMRTYMREHLPLYVFIGVLLLTGVVFGAVMVNALTLEQKQELSAHLGSFFHTLDQKVDFDAKHSFLQTFFLNIKWIILIWILGLSVIGMPIIFVLDFLKGVLIGFTVGYMVGQFSWKGMLFALVSVVPQNLVIIPAIVVCSVTGMAFSIYLIKNRFLQRKGSIYVPFVRHTLLTFGMISLLAIVSLYEAALSPLLMKWVTPMLVALY